MKLKKLLIIFFTLTLASCMVVDNNPYQRKGQTYKIEQPRQKVGNANKVDQTPRIVISPNQKKKAISYNPNQKNRANSSYNQIRNVNPSAGQKKAQTKEEADGSSRKRQQSYSQ